MTRTVHEEQVERQFGPRANAYVTSAVHAAGADLDRIAAVARERRPERALDLGCGGGHVAFALAPHVGRVDACDLSAEMLRAVGAEAGRRGIANLALWEASVSALPFGDGSFDLVASRYSAHHWADLHPGLTEARRVLKPGGAAIFCDVVAPADAKGDTLLQTLEMLRDPSHVRDHTVEEWQRALEAAGFALSGRHEGRLRLDFPSWIGRMQTVPAHVAAIRSLQQGLPDDLAAAFAVEADGSFTVDIATFEATAN
jgi:SAM-dependent methyltransferase